MPDIATHRAQVAHNKAAAATLLSSTDDFRDWVATIYFYAAVHAVDQALYSAEKLSPFNHQQRKAGIARQPGLYGVRNDYLELEYQSRQARYQCQRFSEAEVEALAERLDKIEQQIARLVPAP